MHASFALEGRVAAISGGTGGIGRATAKEMAAQGAQVVIADLPSAPGDALASEIEASGGRACFVPTDVSDPEQWAGLTERCLAEFGRFDVLFNNAGIPAGGPLLDWTPETYRKVVQVNQEGVFYGIQAAARAMKTTGRGGVILNTGSVYGRLAAFGTIGYQATKAAVEVMTRVAALELAGDRIRVVNIAPGIVDTDMIAGYRAAGLAEFMAQKQMGKQLIRPEQIAAVAAFLASDAASGVNGTTIYVDDGYSAFK